MRHMARLFMVAFTFVLIIGLAAPALSATWTQTTWNGGPTTPSLQVGTWTPSYDNFYREENVDWSASVKLKLQPLGAQVIENRLTTADSYVREDQPTTNYGTSTSMYVGHYVTATTEGAERGYLKFDVSGIPSGVTIIGAKLWLYNWGYSNPGTSANVQVERVDDDSWTEGGITWNNQPARTGILVNSQFVQGDNVWKSWGSSALASFVESQRAGDGVASLALVDLGENITGDNHGARFDSKEYLSGTYTPKLEVTYAYNVFRNGWFESSIFDAGSSANWGVVSWDASTPSFGGSDTYVSSYENVKGTVENFVGEQQADGGYATLAEKKEGGGGGGIATHVVISEFATRGPAGATDEFVELYNPTSSAVSIAGWKVDYYATTWNSGYVTTYPTGATIPAHGFYLWGNSNTAYGKYSGPTPADYESLSSGLSDGVSGAPRAIRLINGSIVIDRVGYELDGGTSYSQAEGGLSAPAPAPAGSSQRDRTTERKAQASSTTASMAPGGADEFNGNGYDTDVNANDFCRRDLRDPQSTASATETPPGGAGYDMEIRENIDGIPSSNEYTLQMRYELANTVDSFRVQVWDNVTRNTRGSTRTSTSWTDWSYTLLGSEVIGGKVQVRFVDVDPVSTAQDSILIDYLRVRAAPWSTSLVMYLRTGYSPNPYGIGIPWSGWCQHDNNTENTLMLDGRYVQYRVELSTTNQNQTPVLLSGSVVINYEAADTTPPDAPILISPPYCQDIPDNTPTFTWTTVYDPSGVTYQIQIDNTVDLIVPDFLFPVYDVAGIKENTYTLPDENALQICVHYFWRVRAKDGAGNIGPWSEPWHFHVVPVGAIGALLMSLLFLLPFLLMVRRQNGRYHY